MAQPMLTMTSKHTLMHKPEWSQQQHNAELLQDQKQIRDEDATGLQYLTSR